MPYERQNKQALDDLGKTGAVTYVHARHTLVINPGRRDDDRFDRLAHRGLIRKYDTKANSRLLVVDHAGSDRSEFEDCIRDCGYGKYTVEYTT